MSDLKVSPLIKSLSDNYVHNRITFSEYRLERKIILRQIDSEFNQRVFEDSQSEVLNEVPTEEPLGDSVIEQAHAEENGIKTEE